MTQAVSLGKGCMHLVCQEADIIMTLQVLCGMFCLLPFLMKHSRIMPSLRPDLSVVAVLQTVLVIGTS